MSTRRLFALSRATFLVAAAVCAGPAFAAPKGGARYAVAPGAEAKFLATGKPSMLKINGQGAKISGSLEFVGAEARGTFELSLEDFDTGIELRNRHMREKYLETGKFPRATLEVSRVSLPQGFALGNDVKEAPFQGTLILKGVAKPVEGKVSISGPKLATTAEFSFSLQDYPIGVPSYLGVTVADRVLVQASLPELARK